MSHLSGCWESKCSPSGRAARALNHPDLRPLPTLVLVLGFVGLFFLLLKAGFHAVQTSLQYYPELLIALKNWDPIPFKSKQEAFRRVLLGFGCHFPQTFLKSKGTHGLFGAKDKMQGFWYARGTLSTEVYAWSSSFFFPPFPRDSQPFVELLPA